MRTKNFLLYLFLATCFFACKKPSGDQELPKLSSEKELLEFLITDSLNTAYLSKPVNGDVQADTIFLKLPEEINSSQLIASFRFKGESVWVGNVKQESGITPNDFAKPLTYTVKAEDKSEKKYVIKISLLAEVKSAVPHIYITTADQAPVNSKDTYVKAEIRINGGGVFEDYIGSMSIKGRGNSTWSYPKKPYRLKLDKKAPLLGLSAEKDWILLANYLDESLMCNAVAMKAGRLLEMPFTHHMIPVDVTMNGVYLGNYMFTEHKEVEENRINVGEGGLLLELDTYFDEPYKFLSKNYQLPVMIQYPELDDLTSAEATAELNKIKSDFNIFDDAVNDAAFPHNNYLKYFDAEAFVNYLIVYTLTLNEEINHPKSTYIYKKKDGKYTMGPIWDFDWGFGFQTSYKHFTNPNQPLFWNNNSVGTVFFGRLMQDPVIKSLFKQKWILFKKESYPKLIKYAQEYAAVIRDSFNKDYIIWKNGSGNLDTELNRMLTWFDARVNYIDNLTAQW